MPDESGCQITHASGSMPCDALLQRLVCCMSFGTNRAYGTLLVPCITNLLCFSKVQYITVHCFLPWYFKFLVFLKVDFLKVGFLEIAFRGN